MAVDPGAATPGTAADLSLAKRALLEKRLLARRAAGRREQPIPPRPQPGPWPLSYSQELLWLLGELNPGGNAYNSPDATRLRGPLDVTALRSAVTAVVGRNEVLRTVYRVVDGAPVQVVEPAREVEVPLVDLSDLPGPEREAETARLLKVESERPYDLAHDPVLRATLVRLAPQEHVLLVVVHHIAIDGWSKGVLWSELTAFYEAALHGTEPALEPMPLQYADWAVWHREWLAGGIAETQLEYWRRQLADPPALLDLPTDRPRPPVLSHRGDRTDRFLDADLLAGLHALARAESTTLFVVVLAAFGTLLHRVTGQSDLVVGTPLAGRNRVELERVVGYFMNTLALRMDFTGDPTFREVLRAARETTLQAFAHQDVPFERVVTEVNPDRDLSSTPLFQVMLVLQNQKRSAFGPLGLEAEPVGHERAWSKFDLTVGMGERPTGLNTAWEFATDLFDRATVERLAAGFAAAVTGVLADPDRPVSGIDLLDDAERASLAAWNDTGEARPSEPGRRLLHALVAEAAARAPGASALVEGERVLSHADLDARSAALAHRLVRAGLRPGERVALALGRRAEFVVSLLAVLRAGGVCVPLDLALPAGRLQELVTVSGATHVVHLGPLEVPVADAVVRVDLAEATPAAPPPAPVPGLGADSPAYLLFTSGSTGRPKPVVLTHGGLANHALAGIDLYGMRPDDRTLQFSSLAFDISVEEIFCTLVAGGTLVLRPDDLPLGGPELVQWLEDARISVLDLPTAFWHEWVHDLEVRGLVPPSTLRQVVVGGEKAVAATYATWRRLAGDDSGWVNTYGPTETSVIATAWTPPRGWLPSPGEELPIGRPVPGVRVHLLDPAGRPVPQGVRGEICIAGAGVAAGYLGDEALAAERFTAEPGTGARMYRTGDVARMRSDGELEFAGRRDGQVKLRGYRIEPGEVESALCTHPGIGQAAVLVHGEGAAAQLVAYAAARDHTAAVTGEALRRYLLDLLPAYMVPVSVTVLTELPLTGNGKVDRAALPAPELVGGDLVAPRDEVEETLHGVWAQVLGTEAFGVHDSFFDVGGHSLLAVRMIALVEQRLGTRLPLATVLKAQTVAELADVVRGGREPVSWDCVVPLKPDGSRPPLWCLHLLSGEVIAYRNILRYVHPDQPVYGLQSVGLDGRTPPLIRIEDMAARYISDLRRVQPHGPYLLAGLCFGGVVAYEVARQLRAQGARVALVGLVDARPFGHPATDSEGNPLPARRKLDLVRHPGPDPTFRARYAMAKWLLRGTVRWWVVKALLRLRRSLPERLQDVKRLNQRASATYTAPPYDGDVTVFRASVGKVDDLADRRLHWRYLVSGQMRVRDVPSPGAHHLTLLKEPHVQAFVASLTEAIDEALTPAAARLAREPTAAAGAPAPTDGRT